MFTAMFGGDRMARMNEMIERDKAILVKLGNEEPITLYDFVMKYHEEIGTEKTEEIRHLEVGDSLPIPEISSDVIRVE